MTNWKARAQILEIENRLLREQVELALGVAKPYRAIERATGRAYDTDDPCRLMDHLFAVGGHGAMRRYWIYKNGRRVPMPHGGEVGALARMLEVA